MSFDVTISGKYSSQYLRLNPFRAGQCLSTQVQFVHKDMHKVSIPFEQGNVFRQKTAFQKLLFLVSIPFEQGNVFRLIASEIESKGSVSQSLSSRAMSFDLLASRESTKKILSQSLSSRAMSFDQVLLIL